MFGSRTAWGIDIGESAVRAVKLKVEKSGARIIALDLIERSGRAEGYSYLAKEEQVRGALATFVTRNKISPSSRVALSMPGAGFDRFISLPAVSMKQVPQIVKYEARQQIPFPLEEVAWDYQLASERQVPGEGIEVALFAVKTQIIEQTLAGLSVAKLGVDIIGMSRLALYNFLKYDRQVGDDTIIVDVGAASTDIVMLAEGNFRVRSIPISGEAVTKMLQQKFGISYEEAEELKKKASQSKQPEKLFNVMRPTFERLLGEIHKTIGYYRQQFKTLKAEQAFLVGESFKMQPLVDLFAQSLGCNVNVLSDFRRISVDPEAAVGPHTDNLSSFVVAMGLALQAAGEGPVTINVLPDEVKVGREMARKRPFAVGTAACLGAGVLASFLAAQTDSGRLAKLGDRPEKKIKSAKACRDEFIDASDTREIEWKIAGLADIGKDRAVMLDALNEVAKIFGTDEAPNVPVGIFITKVTMETTQPEKDRARTTTDLLGTGTAREEQQEAPTLQLTIEGWSEHTGGLSERIGAFIHEQVVERLKQIDIFTDVKFEPIDERPSNDGAKPRRVLFTVRIVVTPPHLEKEEP